MIATWLPGQEKTIGLIWTTMEFTVEIPSDRPVSSIQFRIKNDGTDQGSLFVDECAVECGVEVQEEDITYVTQLDHKDQLPNSVQHHLLVAPYLHPPGPCRTISSTSDAGTAYEICYCTGDSKLYLCTATGNPGTWAALKFE